MQIDKSDTQQLNARISIDESREPDSKATVERRGQLEKQEWQRFLTEEGRQIDKSDEQPANADLSICQRSEPDANVTFERDRHSLKQCE
jgi:hypothetical protein